MPYLYRICEFCVQLTIGRIICAIYLLNHPKPSKIAHMSAPEEKEFDRWNNSKKLVDQNSHLVDFHEREIWWCSIGVNIGSEQHSQSKDFSRPVLVVLKFTENMYLGIPLTSKVRRGEFRFPFTLNGIKNDALILQMRSFDAKRFISKIGVLSQPEFDLLNERVAKMFNRNMKTPLEGVSEAEARVCTDVSTKYPYGRSIEEQRLLSRFYGDIYWNRLMLASR